MRAAEIRALTAIERSAKAEETREQMFRLKFQLNMGQTDSLKKYRALRKDLARIKTVENEKGAANAGE